jgi:hypothetical protein
MRNRYICGNSPFRGIAVRIAGPFRDARRGPENVFAVRPGGPRIRAPALGEWTFGDEAAHPF